MNPSMHRKRTSPNLDAAIVIAETKTVGDFFSYVLVLMDSVTW